MKLILYRILGNDLPDRHAQEQTIENLDFILSHEAEHPFLEKRWLLNRIVNPEQQKLLLDMIAGKGHKAAVLPFNEDHYLQCWSDVGTMPLENLPGTRHFKSLDQTTQARIVEYIRRSKSYYLINNNGARNYALALGFNDNADWVLPWDGGCFLTKSAWQAIYEGMREHSELSYISVPMARIDDNDALLDSANTFTIDQEPQLCFSRHAHLYFDPSLRYGSMPKSRLLQRIGIPGRWQKDTGHFPWENMDFSLPGDNGNFKALGWVARLAGHGESERFAVNANRWASRFRGTVAWTETVDRQLIRSRLKSKPLLCWIALNDGKFFIHESIRGSIAQYAEHSQSISDAHLKNAIESRRFSSPNRYGSQNFTVVDVLSALCLDYAVNNSTVSGARLYRLIKRLFINEAGETITSPDFLALLSSQTENNQPCPGSALAAIYPICDAITIILKSDFVSAGEAKLLANWLEQLLNWLINSKEGISFSNKTDHTGTAYHLSLLALAACLGKEAVVDNVLNSIPRLMAKQFTCEGRQQLGTHSDNFEIKLFNLCLWCNVATVCSVLGRNLWSFTDSANRGIGSVFSRFTSDINADNEAMHSVTLRQHLFIINQFFGVKNALFKQGSSTAAAAVTTGCALPPFWSLCLEH
ncbi:alginate lyase family protein [Acinetobacter sp.]|uniref:alginate lyase family protein n=1 Tax=Acinetobacter sp. TaxID=472 RepID=UPI003D07C799